MSKPMMRNFGIGIALLVTAVACGSSSTDGAGGGGAGKGSSGDLGGGGNSSGSLGDGDGDGDGNGNGDPAACATSSAVAEPTPIYLVFMYDKSGSMVNDNSPKWSSSKTATKAFFESPQSKGISASLSYFPQSGTSCNANDYTTPQIPMTALPATTFGANLDAQDPNGGTPTRAALEGAISYAQSVASGQGKDGKVAIVLVTDGFPEGCSGNSIANVKALAAGVAATIPTYVIGVGDQLTSLNEIAIGGGTNSALIVSTSDPDKIKTDFTKAIEQIKSASLSCEYKIPPPPAGQTFDRTKVNVQFTPTGGAAAAPYQYNQDCTGGTGWRYDDANNPTQVIICGTTCDEVKGKDGKLDILFGCATKGDPVK
jgi:von Willebrand factor type A domain